MTSEKLKEIDGRIATDYQGCRSLPFLLGDTRELREHIEQLTAERDRLREVLDLARNVIGNCDCEIAFKHRAKARIDATLADGCRRLACRIHSSGHRRNGPYRPNSPLDVAGRWSMVRSVPRRSDFDGNVFR